MCEKEHIYQKSRIKKSDHIFTVQTVGFAESDNHLFLVNIHVLQPFLPKRKKHEKGGKMKIEKEDLITDITAIFLPRILVASPPSLNLVASSSRWTVCQSQQHGPTGILPFSSHLPAPS